MLQTFEAVIDEKGVLRLLESIKLPKLRRVLITILDEEPSEDTFNLALLSEAVLAKDWLRPEEDEAWLHLAQLPSL
jgi:predicted DNA-binding antitoxin AbrB/MazE fold protein